MKANWKSWFSFFFWRNANPKLWHTVQHQSQPHCHLFIYFFPGLNFWFWIWVAQIQLPRLPLRSLFLANPYLCFRHCNPAITVANPAECHTCLWPSSRRCRGGSRVWPGHACLLAFMRHISIVKFLPFFFFNCETTQSPESFYYCWHKCLESARTFPGGFGVSPPFWLVLSKF